ncbi:MAG TPA: NAD(P)/FAD-dependent oxidoreductase [Sandaracinaceae bacterium LLY-WYZ-13_1]|nr:NAD(P)/FAD-dependent oxidoreductase [Sandaracinaceae bacterium LLY-WYZ-13_1]
MDVDAAIVGAGVVGLACAAELARAGHEVVVIERHEGAARETTSRNSGVVHAGLYYAPGSIKARTCVEGRALLYARCRRDAVPHRKTGKLIVATDDAEREVLDGLLARGRANRAGDLRLVDRDELARLEPRVRAVAALWSPESGIVDVHGLCDSFAAEATAHGASLAYHTRLEALEPAGHGWRLDTVDADGERFSLVAGRVVNAAGLASDRIAALAGLDVDALGWRLRYCKGDYFGIAPRLGRLTSHLVYPVPAHAGLGVHVTMDLGGVYRAGPDAEYVDAPRYDVDPDKGPAFAAALRRYLPEIRDEDLAPDYAGVRPKLYGPDEPSRDFVLEERPAGLFHLVGIESPGVTAAEALARALARRLA